MITSTEEFLNKNPLLGFFSGLASWVLYLLHQVLTICTDEDWLKIVAAVGIWATAVVALLNLAAKLITWAGRVAKRIKAYRVLKAIKKNESL